MTAQDDGPGSYAITYDKLEVTRARCQMHPDARFIQIHPDSFLCNAVSCCVLQTYQRRLEIELVTPTPAYARSGSEIVGKLAAGGVVLVLEACVSRVSREHWRRDHNVLVLVAETTCTRRSLFRNQRTCTICFISTFSLFLDLPFHGWIAYELHTLASWINCQSQQCVAFQRSSRAGFKYARPAESRLLSKSALRTRLPL